MKPICLSHLLAISVGLLPTLPLAPALAAGTAIPASPAASPATSGADDRSSSDSASAAKKPGYKQLKEACLKENAALKGAELRKCIKTKNGTGLKSVFDPGA